MTRVVAYSDEVLIGGEIFTVVDVCTQTQEIGVLDYNFNKSWKLISEIEKIL